MVAGLSGRVALPAAYARRARARASRSCCGRRSGRTRARPPHALSYLPLRHIYRHADAIVTYGPHVSRLRARQGRARTGRRGAAERRRRVLDRARPRPIGARRSRRCSSGRIAAGEGPRRAPPGLESSGLAALSAALVLVGDGPIRARAVATGAVLPDGRARRPKCATSTRAATLWSYRRSPRATSCEPWGLVVNEAFNQGVPVIATDRRRRRRRRPRPPRAHRARRPRRATRRALAAALRRLHDDPALRARLGAAGREAVAAYTHDAWAAGMSRALAAVGAKSRLLAWTRHGPSAALLSGADPARSLPRRRARASARRSSRDCQTTARIDGNYTPSRAPRRAQATSRPTSTSTPTAATCSRAPRSAAAAPTAARRRRRRRRRRLGGAGRRAAGSGAPATSPTASGTAGASRPRSTEAALDGGDRAAPTVGGERRSSPAPPASPPTPAATSCPRPLLVALILLGLVRARPRPARPSADVSSLAGSA